MPQPKTPVDEDLFVDLHCRRHQSRYKIADAMGLTVEQVRWHLRSHECVEFPPLDLIAYGGGVQSTAMIVLATQGKLAGFEPKHALFANVGDDSENPRTLEYVRDVMAPWAAERGVEVVELERYRPRTDDYETLYGRMMREGSKSLPIPVRMSNGAPGRRACTYNFKVEVMGRWIKANGGHKTNPANVCLGISMDEAFRVKKNSKFEEPWEIVRYPLLDLKLDRDDCKRIIAEAGLPVPYKSACYFCPFHKKADWVEMSRDQPILFKKTVEIERRLNERRATLGKDKVWMSDWLKPLDEAVEEFAETIEDDDGHCDEGYCFV